MPDAFRRRRHRPLPPVPPCLAALRSPEFPLRRLRSRRRVTDPVSPPRTQINISARRLRSRDGSAGLGWVSQHGVRGSAAAKVNQTSAPVPYRERVLQTPSSRRRTEILSTLPLPFELDRASDASRSPATDPRLLWPGPKLARMRDTGNHARWKNWDNVGTEELFPSKYTIYL